MAEKKEEKKQEDESLHESAYYKWEKAGRPESDGKEFWYEAEKEKTEKKKK